MSWPKFMITFDEQNISELSVLDSDLQHFFCFGQLW